MTPNQQRVGLLLQEADDWTVAEIAVSPGGALRMMRALQAEIVRLNRQTPAEGADPAQTGEQESLGTYCRECNDLGVQVDEDGCCVTCGYEALFYDAAWEAIKTLAEERARIDYLSATLTMAMNTLSAIWVTRQHAVDEPQRRAVAELRRVITACGEALAGAAPAPPEETP